MKIKYTLLISILILNICLIHAQTNCNHEQTIISFLNKISSPQYKSSQSDFDTFFDSYELEGGLRSDYLKAHPNTKLLDTTDLSMAIDRLLNNDTMRRMIEVKNRQNNKWTISQSYKYGSATIVYVIKINNSNDFMQIQMVNCPDREMCKICDIIDSKGKSIYY